MALDAMDDGNARFANDILDSIAKEVGNGYWCRHRPNHAGANQPLVATIHL